MKVLQVHSGVVFLFGCFFSPIYVCEEIDKYPG